MKALTRVSLIALVGAALWFAMQTVVHKKEQDRAAFMSQPRPVATVEVETVRQETWQRYLLAIGSFTAVNDVAVTNEIEGKVMSIQFESGQTVKQGDVLVTLDTSVDIAELEALIAEQRLNELQFERSKKLVADKTISKSEFDIAAARRDEAVAMARAKAAGVRKKTIRAPFSGTLGLRKIDIGQYLDAGSDIVVLQSLSPIYLDFATPERFISRVSLGQAVEAEVHAYPGEVFHGEISAVEPGIELATRNMRIRARFDNAEQRLRPGMFAEIRSTVPQSDTVLTVPETAITYTPYGNSLFIVEQTGETAQAVRKQVKTGEVRDGRVRILDGLDATSNVVTAGHNKLRNGMPVQTIASQQFSSTRVAP